MSVPRVSAFILRSSTMAAFVLSVSVAACIDEVPGVPRHEEAPGPAAKEAQPTRSLSEGDLHVCLEQVDHLSSPRTAIIASAMA